MPSSLVFIELMVHACYSPLCKNAKDKFGKKKSLNVSNVKLLSNFFFNVFGFFQVIFRFGALIEINMFVCL